jgi:hypothetical protein
MHERTTTKTVFFNRPFTLEAEGKLLSPGPYVVEIEEEQIQGLSFIAYRRVRTTITLPSSAFGSTTARQVVAIEPAELDAALARDAEPE